MFSIFSRRRKKAKKEKRNRSKGRYPGQGKEATKREKKSSLSISRTRWCPNRRRRDSAIWVRIGIHCRVGLCSYRIGIRISLTILTKSIKGILPGLPLAAFARLPPLAAPLLQFFDAVPLLVHLFPLREGRFDSQSCDTDCCSILEHVLRLALASFFRCHFTLGYQLAPLFRRYHGRVDAVGGVDRRDRGQPGSKKFLTSQLLALFLHVRRGFRVGAAVPLRCALRAQCACACACSRSYSAI
ncbi:hypothetical protein BU26DRAFT_9804 [Trematosphaeria pertusa]|uniref:Uncharacterized protein n=1 Tax=Trematosphaeria pertusa TaxID=390896 RepID=A0A6A6J316_9PLEO|nr:uncharacterized protein BU26DRAFT_9804 [Trematosphaeria pertusa]KAF2255853.1 hypothetical protein BU26DRAFT_9804 [Trematosphaeria pertusa]